MPVWIAIAVGAVSVTTAIVVAVHALRRRWARSARAADRVVRRATDEEIEMTLTADLFAGAVDGDLYRRALELLASHESPIPRSVARWMTADLPRD